MALEIRANSVAKGIDPREYSLVAFGGAGPLHGVALAKTVAAREVLVPPAPGINAATGLLATDMQYEFTRSVLITISEADAGELEALNQQLGELYAQADESLGVDGVAPEERKFTRIAECRYQGQGFELRAEFPEGVVDGDNKQVLIDNFHKSHSRDYGHAFEDQNVEIITLRVIASAATTRLNWPKLPAGVGENPEDAVMYNRPTTFDGGEMLDTPRYDRAKLAAGQSVSGPAIIIQHDSTTLIPPGHLAEVSEFGNLHVREKV